MTIDAEDKWIGKRVARWRDVAGMTQQQLADAVGHTREYISLIENGHKAITKRSLLISLAGALGVAVTDLIAAPFEPTSREDMLALAVAAGVRRALDDDPNPTLRTPDELADRAWAVIKARMQCDNQTLSSLLPQVIAESRSAAMSDNEAYQTAGLDALVKTCVYGSYVLKTSGNMDLSMRMAERAKTAADRLGSPVHTAAAQMALAQSLMAGGLRERALATSMAGLEAVQHMIDNPAGLVWYGTLHLQAGLCASSLSRPDDAAGHMQEAQQAAERVDMAPTGWGNEFTPANVQLWKVGVALENGDTGRAPELARLVNPAQLKSPQRVCRLHIDTGRAYYQVGRHDDAVREFQAAYTAAPTEVRHRASVREITGELVRTARRNAGSPALRDLALKVGVDPTQEVSA